MGRMTVGEDNADMISTIVAVNRKEPDEWIPLTSYSAIEWAFLPIFKVDKGRIEPLLYFQILT